jgi:hypothetical protein
MRHYYIIFGATLIRLTHLVNFVIKENRTSAAFFVYRHNSNATLQKQAKKILPNVL